MLIKYYISITRNKRVYRCVYVRDGKQWGKGIEIKIEMKLNKM